MSLLTQVIEVNEARKRLAALNTEYEKVLRAWEERHAILLSDRLQAREELQAKEEALRQAAIQNYAETLDKHPTRGVSIRVLKRLQYAESTAIDWAITNLIPDFLKLNKGKFEKYAKAVAETMPLEFVTIREEPQATIATDLDKALEGVKYGPKAPETEAITES